MYSGLLLLINLSKSSLFLPLFSVRVEHINNFKELFPGKVLYKDYKMENKDLQSSENMDLSGIFATNRNILKSVCRLLKKSKSTLFQKKTKKKYMKRAPCPSDENKTESRECTRVEVSNLETDSEDSTSLQNEWLIHLVLGNLPRDGGLRLIETDTPNVAEKDHIEVSSPKRDIKGIAAIVSRHIQI